MTKFPKAIIFDLDGTLVESAPDLTAALKLTFLVKGLKPHSELKVRQWIGNGIDKLLHRGLTNSMDGIAAEKLFNSSRKIFIEAYKNQIGEKSLLYPGVLNSLKNFRQQKIKMACITNKDRNFTIQLLEKLDVSKFFEIVVCGDDLTHKKPHPEPLIFAAKEMKLKPSQCLMIGDSKTDVNAANAADIDIICVDYGYAQGENLESMNIKALISNFDEIDQYFKKGLIKKCG